ncbi:MAG TPA: HipA family kinase [Gemmatimonadaceae bacterium]|nr:HipA family kinase [Gemmatimonadaceae bacterium]
MLPTHDAVRYVQPLREGGSLPAVVDTDGGGLYVVKFRGAGQGPKVLVAELVVGLLAQRLGLPVPELALVDVSPRFGQSEPDPEIQELLRRSHGVNVGLRYLDGAFNFDQLAAGELVTPDFAARLVWFDALVTNPDRTHRNPNLLVWQRRPWMIDHGAALYAHHDWPSVTEERARAAFPFVRQHVLLARAGDIAAADAALAPLLDSAALDDVLAAVPDALLAGPLSAGDFADARTARERYREFLLARLRGPRAWVTEAETAQGSARAEPPRRLSARR